MSTKVPFKTTTNGNVTIIITVALILLFAADLSLARPYGAGLYNSGIYEACTPPYPLGDQTEDCRVRLDDLAIFVNDWLRCNDPGNTDCEETW